MTVLELMERLGVRETKKIVAYINDALREIAELSYESEDTSLISIVSGTRLYTLPSGYGKIIGVYQIYDTANGTYTKISRIQNIDIIQDASAASESGTIVVI